MITLTVNGKSHSVEAAADTPLLWVLREHLGLNGTKYSCGIGECGSCNVHMNGELIKSCQTSIGKAAGATVTLIAEEFVGERVTLDEVCAVLEGAILKRRVMG
ncbi:MAG: 2Fe-2S iron-sulfur cluster-binding protein, partial [Alphaproteobacteria bacterium]|nr:2Fe-2S iron-sulfur cluster-binding protein [Alphaproteobacteria bacterium]